MPAQISDIEDDVAANSKGREYMSHQPTEPATEPAHDPQLNHFGSSSPLSTDFEPISSDPAGISPGLPAKSVWRNRDFLLLWSGQNTSILGAQMSELAYPILVLALTHSPAKAGLVPLFFMLPFIVFGLPAGALVDRWNRKKVMLICDTIRMFAMAALPISFLTGHLSLALVYAASLTEGVGFCFFNLAETAAISQVVEKAQLPNAMAANEMGYAATSTAGPGLAGLIMASMRSTVAGAMLAFAVDSVSYLASLGTLLMMRTPFQQERAASGAENAAKPNLWHEVREGLQFVWNQVRVRTIMFWAGFLALTFGGFGLDDYSAGARRFPFRPRHDWLDPQRRRYRRHYRCLLRAESEGTGAVRRTVNERHHRAIGGYSRHGGRAQLDLGRRDELRSRSRGAAVECGSALVPHLDYARSAARPCQLGVPAADFRGLPARVNAVRLAA